MRGRQGRRVTSECVVFPAMVPTTAFDRKSSLTSSKCCNATSSTVTMNKLLSESEKTASEHIQRMGLPLGSNQVIGRQCVL